MALDSIAKRGAVAFFGFPARLWTSYPDGSIDADDRASLLALPAVTFTEEVSAISVAILTQDAGLGMNFGIGL